MWFHVCFWALNIICVLFREKYFWFILFHHDRIWCDLSEICNQCIFWHCTSKWVAKELNCGERTSAIYYVRVQCTHKQRPWTFTLKSGSTLISASCEIAVTWKSIEEINMQIGARVLWFVSKFPHSVLLQETSESRAEFAHRTGL